MANTWQVYPHGPLQHLEDNLWLVEGTVPNMSLGRKMAVVRLSTGKLVIYNPVNVDENTLTELTTLGEIAYVLVPNGFHRMDCAAWKERFPSAKVLAPSGSVDKVKEKVQVDGTVDELPPDPAFEHRSVAGTKDSETLCLVRSGANLTLIVTDALFNLAHQGGFGGFMLRLLGSSGGLKVTRIFRLMALKDSAALRAQFLELAELPGLSRLIMAHGTPMEGDIGAHLKVVASTL